jgi:two-component system, NarL family, nitrate/nitrite response regulator NarL
MRVLICDDHPIVASAIGMTLETRFGAQVEIATCCAAALDLARADGPFDLLLLDLHIPHEDPLDNLRAVREVCPETPIVVFSASEDIAHLRHALALDVRGFIPKSSRPEVIEAALRLVLAGGRYLPEPVGLMALGGAASGDGSADHAATSAAAKVAPAPACLTERQIEVLRMLAGGAENKQIARTLGISPYTVKAHVAQVLQCLGAHNRTQAVDLARRQGVI